MEVRAVMLFGLETVEMRSFRNRTSECLKVKPEGPGWDMMVGTCPDSSRRCNTLGSTKEGSID